MRPKPTARRHTASTDSSQLSVVTIEQRAVTSSNRGRVVRKECDHGPDVLLTDHASRSTRAVPRNPRWKAARPRRSREGEPDERRVDEGVGMRTLCGTRKFGHRVAAVRVRQERHFDDALSSL